MFPFHHRAAVGRCRNASTTSPGVALRSRSDVGAILLKTSVSTGMNPALDGMTKCPSNTTGMRSSVRAMCCSSPSSNSSWLRAASSASFTSGREYGPVPAWLAAAMSWPPLTRRKETPDCAAWLSSVLLPAPEMPPKKCNVGRVLATLRYPAHGSAVPLESREFFGAPILEALWWPKTGEHNAEFWQWHRPQSCGLLHRDGGSQVGSAEVLDVRRT